MRRRSTVVCGLLVVITGAFSIVVKTEVQEQEDRLERINRDIAGQIETINVLRAEWSYVNRPARLESLARRHLGLQVATPAQKTRISDLPFAGRPDAPGPAPAKRPSGPLVKIYGPSSMAVGGVGR